MVLLADAASFEAGYLVAVLHARGVEVLGPSTDLSCALAAIATPRGCLVVLAHPFGAEDRGRLIEALSASGTPCLTLPPSAALRPLRHAAVLERPFAAYQVADWVIGHLAPGSA